MTTITEFQPLIFSRLLDHVEPQKTSRISGILTVVELAGGLWLSIDTGIAPWQWQFWLMFAPFFVAGEMAIRAWNAK